MCVECGLCTTKCKFDAIHLEKISDLHAENFEKMPIKVAAYVLKKTGKMISKPFTKG